MVVLFDLERVAMGSLFPAMGSANVSDTGAVFVSVFTTLKIPLKEEGNSRLTGKPPLS